MMKCTFCGKDVSDEARICPHCGIYISRTFREPSRDISSGDDRISPEGSVSPGGSQDYLNPREQRSEISPADAAQKAPEEASGISGPDAEPMPDSGFKPSPAPWQPPHDLPKKPEASSRKNQPRRDICSSCGSSLMPGDRFCNICGTKVPDENPGYPRNDINPPVNEPQELRALNRRMDLMSSLVLAELCLGLGGIAIFLVIIAVAIIAGMEYAELLRPLSGLGFCLVIIAGMVHAAVLLESVPLIPDVVSFLDSQGTEYWDLSAKGRKARVIIRTLLIFIGVFVAMFFLTMGIAVGNRGGAPLTESGKVALCIVGVIDVLLLITDIVLQIHAARIFRDIKRKLKNMADPVPYFDGKTVKKPKRR
ncbi:zinc-ribbon domain-containing protein [Succinimonas sp.]|uniref:zinc-ribbon domain-containing protein n=1 Tax=Succinimonas sp. TaxID=1936151 RepID=UPI00386E26EA